MSKNRTLSMLVILALVTLFVVSLTVGALGVGLFVAGWGLGWLTAT